MEDSAEPGFADLVRRRRMTRAFTDAPVDNELVDRMLDLARRGPSAGNAATPEFLVLSGAHETARYWRVTFSDEGREGFPWPELFHAPVLIVPWVSPDAYVERYREADKAHTGLGASQDAWPVPYWFVDGGAAAMTLLLAAETEGLGALLFGLFDHEEAVREEFGVPGGLRALGTIALGQRAADRSSSSTGRSKPPLDEIVHRGCW